MINRVILLRDDVITYLESQPEQCLTYNVLIIADTFADTHSRHQQHLQYVLYTKC